MATLMSASDSNLTAAAWAQVATAAAALVDSEAGSTALTTGNLDSAAFVLAAEEVDGFAVKLASRAAGAPANTITLSLRNATAGANVWSVTLNVSDLNACGATEREGGWYFINGGAPHTPNGTDSYVIRATLSATSTAVSLWTNGTANNWSRIVRRTATAAAAAGDILHIVSEWTAAATKTNRIITMDSTATTAYGNGVTGTTFQIPGLTINKGATLAYGTAAVTAYVLRMNGSIVIYSSGTFTIGSVAAPIPRTSTAVLEFSCAADANFGLCCRNGSVFDAQGLSRTVGKNVVWTLLTADLAGAGVAATVADDTGWLTGDEVAIAATTATQAENEAATLSGDAGATSLAFAAGVGYAHKGVAATLTQAEVILLTRNVKIRSTNASYGFTMDIHQTAIVDCDWAEFQYQAYNAGGVGAGLRFTTTTGSVTASYCSFRDARGQVWMQVNVCQAGAVLTLEHAVTWNTNVGGASGVVKTTVPLVSAGGTITVNDLVMLKNNGTAPLFQWGESGGTTLTLTNLRGCGGAGIFNIQTTRNWLGQVPMGPLTAHGVNQQSTAAITISGFNENLVIAGLLSFRNKVSNNGGISLTGDFLNLDVAEILAYGSQFGVEITSTVFTGVVRSFRAYGDTAFAQATGLSFAQPTAPSTCILRIDRGIFGSASGVWTTHGTADIDFAMAGRALVQLTLNNVVLASATPVQNFTYASKVAYGSFLHYQRYQGIAGNHKAEMLEGTLSYETTTVDVTPSVKLTPATAAVKLRSNGGIPGSGFLVFVTNGEAPIISIKVQTDGAYNGAAPRLILLANSALGIDADQVLATCPAGAGVWHSLYGVLAPVTDDGVLEVYVDADGTAGAVYVDTAMAG